MTPGSGGGGGGAAELWLPVSSELISGVHHALNNRLGALSAVAQVLEAEMGSTHPLRAALAEEVERLQGTVRMLTLLPRRPGASAEPVLLPDLLASAVELFQLHHGVRDTPYTVEGGGDVLPVYCEPTLLAHLLITLMVAAGERARAAGGGVRVRYSGDAREVRISVAASGAGAEYDEVSAEALQEWAERLGGILEGGPGGAQLRLPTLPEVRRRERESGS